MLVHRITSRLDHEHVHAANILQQLKVNLAIGEALHLGFAHRQPDDFANFRGQLPVCRS